jgi:chromosome segregation ATPase
VDNSADNNAILSQLKNLSLDVDFIDNSISNVHAETAKNSADIEMIDAEIQRIFAKLDTLSKAQDTSSEGLRLLDTKLRLQSTTSTTLELRIAAMETVAIDSKKAPDNKLSNYSESISVFLKQHGYTSGAC